MSPKRGHLANWILLAASVSWAWPRMDSEPAAPPATRATSPSHAPRLEVDEGVLGAGSTFYQALQRYPDHIIRQAVRAAASHYNLGTLRAGTGFRVIRHKHGPILEIAVRIEPERSLLLLRTPEGMWQTRWFEHERTSQRVAFAGTVRSTFWESAAEQGMDPTTIIAFAEIFAWELDFERELRPGDRWRLTVERHLIDGQPHGWGAIRIADYERSRESHRAIYFPKLQQYYTEDGASLRGAFLKSPLRFGRISSHFQRRRYHPVLKIHRPHYGVDYAAPTGTPVRAVGKGVVTRRRNSRTAGRYIKIRHNSTYETAYKHLSRFGKGIREGRRVEQGQVIGYVGATGLATGPHLHFEFYERGRYIDPLGRKFPRAPALPKKHRDAFAAVVSDAQAGLPPWPGTPTG